MLDRIEEQIPCGGAGFWIVAGIIMVGIIGGLIYTQSRTSAECREALEQAEHQRRHADEAKEAADKADEEASAARAASEQAGAEVARLRRMVERAKASVRPLPAPFQPAGPGVVAAPLPADLSSVVEAQDALIQGLDHQIQTQNLQISSLTLARDSWKSAFEAERKRSEFQAIAIQGQASAIRAAEWRGGFKGATVAALLGLVLGGR